MHTCRQVFRNDFAAVGALLRRSTRVNQHALATSLLSFVAGVLYQLVPRGVADALVQRAVAVFLHVADVKVLEHDDLKFVHQPPAQLMSKVLTAVGDALVDVLNDALMLPVFRRAFVAPREAALRLRQRPLVLPEEARVGDLLASRERGKVGQAEVDAHDMRRRRQRIKLDFDRETGVPVTERVLLDGQRLNLALEGAVQHDSHIADLRQIQAVAVKTKAVLRVGEGFVPARTLEAGVAGFLACFYAAKERLEGQINAGADFLQALREGIVEKRMILLPSGQHLDRVVAADAFLPLLPRLLAGFQHFVVDPTAGIQRPPHGGALRCCGEKAVLVGQSHTLILHYFMSQHKRHKAAVSPR